MKRQIEIAALFAPKIVVFGILIIAVMVAGTSAQVDDPSKRGIQGGASYSISDIETINNTNGNVMFSIPLASLPTGRGGISAGISLNYNSKIWDTGSPPGFIIPPGYDWNTLTSPRTFRKSDDGGWRYGIGYKFRQKRRPYLTQNQPCYGEQQPIEAQVRPNRFVMIFPDGSEHQFAPSAYYVAVGLGHTGEADGYYSVDVNGNHIVYRDIRNPIDSTWLGCALDTIPYTGGMTFHSTDGANMRLWVAHDGDSNPDNNYWIMIAPDGSRITHNEPLSGGGTAQQRIYDKNNNFVTITTTLPDANTEITQVTDQLERTLTVSRDLDDAVDTISSDGFNGADLTWTVHWTDMQVSRQYQIGDPNIFGSSTNLSGSFKMVSGITLPSQAGGQSYSFEYNGKAPGVSGYTNGFGEIKHVELPSGAEADYEYKLDGEGSIVHTWYDSICNPIKQKTLSYTASYDGSSSGVTEKWLYDITREQSIITGPDGGITKSYYPDVLIEEDGGVILKTVSPDGTINQKGHYIGSSPYWNKAWNNLVGSDFTTIPDSNGNPSLTAIKTYEYDKNGNLLRTKEYDWVPYSSVISGEILSIPSNAVLKRIVENEYYNPAAAIPAYPTQIDPSEYRTTTSPRVLNAVKAVVIKNGAGTPVSRTELYYDSLTTAGNLIETKSWDSYKGGTARAYSNPLTSTNSISVTTTYNSFGALTLITDANGSQTNITYGNVPGPNGNATGLYPTQTEVASNYSSLKRTSTAVYDYYTGLVKSTTDEDNDITNSIEYDDLGRPTKTITATGTSLESWTRIEYDAVNRKIVVRSDLETKGDGRKISIQHFDQLNRIRLSRTLENAATEDPADETDGIKVQTRYAYDNPTDPENSSGIYSLTSNPYRAAHSYDAAGEETMGWTFGYSSKTGLTSTTKTYEGTGLPAPWGGNTATTGTMTIERNADRTLVMDPAGKRKVSRNNALGQLTDIWEVTPQDAATVPLTFPGQYDIYAGYLTNYGYDTLGNLTEIAQGGQARNFNYNSISRLISAVNPESGSTSYIYDANGNLTQKSDARGIIILYVYDALNRIKQRSYSGETGYQTPMVSYEYDNLPHAIGKLTKVSSSVSANEFTSFDIIGRATASKQTTDGREFPMSYLYNLSGSLTEQTYPSGRAVQNILDAEGNLSAVRSKKNSAAGYWNYADSFTYNSAGAAVSLQLGNGKWESTKFNSRFQPTRIALGNIQNAANLLKLDFAYGTTQNNGNILSQTITVSDTAKDNGFTAIQTYTYDSLNRIKSASETIDSNQGWSQAFLYDRYGNRTFDEPNTTTLTKNCGSSPNFTVCVPDRKLENPEILPSNNRIKTDQDGDNIADYVFDSGGNTKKTANGLTYVYDGENKQVEALNAANQPIGYYYYDGEGKRVKKVVPGTGETTLFVYDAGGKLIAEYSTILAETPQAAYTTSDNLSSPRISTSADGAVIARHDYHPFGEEIDIVASPERTEGLGYKSDELRKKFTGYERDGETGLDYAQARYYASYYGRFSTPDPVKMRKGRQADPQRINLYVYTRNNPYKFVDISGEDLVLASNLKPKEREFVVKNLARLYMTKRGRAAIEKADNSRFIGVVGPGSLEQRN